jgi:sarcosine oxidase subunit beta
VTTPVIATRTDILIIGAGVCGSALAWELARRRRKVLVLEAGAIASGASGGPGKRGVRANGRDARELPLMRRAYELWPALADLLDGETGFERIGHLELVERPEDAARAEARLAEQRRHGIPTELLAGAELRALEPDLAAGVRAALHGPLDGVADHTATTHAYARAAERCGATFSTATRATQLVGEAGRVRAAVTAEGDRIEIGTAVVVAANQGVADLVSPLGTHLPTFPVLPQVLITRPLVRPVVRHLIGHAHRRLALKALPDGALMITGGWLGMWNAERRAGEPVAEAVAANLAEAIEVYPCLDGTELAMAVADRTESVAPDLVPIIDVVPGLPNCLFATGWSGHGWAIAPAVAELLATWLIRGDRPAALAPFACRRSPHALPTA